MNDLNNKNSLNKTDFLDTLALHFLTLPHAGSNKANQAGPTSANVVDNIFTNHPLQNRLIPKIVVDDMSVHFPVFLSADLIHDSKAEPVTFRRLVGREPEFGGMLSNENWSNVTNSCTRNITDVYSTFLDKYLKIYNTCFSLVRSHKSAGSKNEWVTADLLKSCKKKNILCRNYMKDPTIITK